MALKTTNKTMLYDIAIPWLVHEDGPGDKSARNGIGDITRAVINESVNRWGEVTQVFELVPAERGHDDIVDRQFVVVEKFAGQSFAIGVPAAGRGQHNTAAGCAQREQGISGPVLGPHPLNESAILDEFDKPVMAESEGRQQICTGPTREGDIQPSAFEQDLGHDFTAVGDHVVAVDHDNV